MIGFVIGCAAVLFYLTVERAWWITNLMAFGFAYGAMQVISPTTFTTGSLVLAGLFIYDIVMVFYTPMMATVATSLDVPIKLVFPGPKHGSMLGLGDVVVPGMMLALALRFDLYLHYLHKQVKVKDTISEPNSNSGTSIRKEKYLDPNGLWGDRFWTRNATKESLSIADGARFSKVYFKAGLTGYVIGMIVTLYVCHTFNAAQPALLYLVPGVLIALWGTAFVRGELSLMVEYTEDGKWGWDEQSSGKTKKLKSGQDEAVQKSSGISHAHHIFLLSLSDPKHSASKKKSS